MEIKLNPAVFWYKKKQLINKLMRAFIFLYSAIVFSFTPTNVVSQNSTISISSNEILSVEQVFDLIMNQTEYNFIYEEGTFKDFPQVYVKKGKIKTNKLLQLCLENQHLDITLTANNTILISKKPTISQAIQQQLTGVIKDETGLPIPGVTILIKGTQTGTSTDFDGKFSLTVPGPSTILVFTSIGYQTKEITVGEQKNLTVVLKEELNTLDEVIITGYQKVAIERSTGSATTIKSKDIEKKGQSNLLNSLEGMVAGLGISADPSSEGNKKINIRGVATINGNSDPLIVIDGFPVETSLDQINPYDVESITVLKDAASASIYGARAANGVIVITTKRGVEGNVKIDYTNNFTFNEKPDVAYRLNRVSSSDLVDIQMIGALNDGDRNHTYQYYLDNGNTRDQKFARNSVFNTMAQLKEGKITQTEADGILNSLRNIDNTSQLQDLFTQSPYEEQHNIGLSGGGDKSVYRTSLNYTKNKTSFVGDKSERVIFNIQNNIKLGEKLKLDLSSNFIFNNHERIPYDRNIVFNQVNSYQLLQDENGNPLPVSIGSLNSSSYNEGLFGGKDPLEIQRLIDLGLYDETYYPLLELENYSQQEKGFNARMQAMLHADIAQGLKGTFGFKYERSSINNTRIANEDSYEMKSLVNNMSPLNYSGDDGDLWIPRGARITETTSESNAYTLRGQLDFNKSFEKHNFRALAGTELRNISFSSTSSDQFGYDDSSLLFRFVDKETLSNTAGVTGINHPDGRMYGGIPFYDGYKETTDRFFSAYGNFSYDFDQRYVITGSMRLDQSNLFGTDPEYRYKPFWSVGSKWNIDQEDFFSSKLINKLSLRLTYGINGNIANDYGPFNIAESLISYRTGYANSYEIKTPALDNLRWERTATTNFGLDLTMLERRIRVGADYYIKNTDDVLADAQNDPTDGFSSIMKNDGNIKNTGLEISLTTANIVKDNFNWSSTFTFRKNKNRVLKILRTELGFLGSTYENTHNIQGYPSNSFFLANWAGLTENGHASVYNKDGTLTTVNNIFDVFDGLVDDAIVYAGSVNPKVSGSFSNNLSYKNFNLSFMFVFNYGHKMLKDSYYGGGIGPRPRNYNADAAFAWENPGDELTTDIPQLDEPTGATGLVSEFSTKNIIDAGYMRLREVIFSYKLPKNMIKVLNVSNASLNFRANNLWLIENNKEGIDPEAHGFATRYFPIKPSYSFGINVGF